MDLIRIVVVENKVVCSGFEKDERWGIRESEVYVIFLNSFIVKKIKRMG